MRHQRAVVLLLLIGVVLSSGCSGLSPSRGDDTSPEREGGSIAPGVTTNGVQNTTAFGQAHDRQLRERSATLAVTITTRYQNGSLRGRSRAVSRLEPPETSLRDVVLQGTATTAGTITETTWSNDTVRVFRWKRANGSTEYEVQSGDIYYKLPPGHLLASTFGDRSVQVVDRRRGADNETRVILRTDDPSMSRYFSRDEAVRNASMRVTVTESGLVRSATVRYEQRGGVWAVGPGEEQPRTDEFVEVTWHLELSDHGTTTVARPSWVDEALASTDGSEQ